MKKNMFDTYLKLCTELEPHFQQHWNNPLRKPGLTDSSGLKIYHTPNKRTNDAAYSVWGASTLEIPYGAKNVLQTGGCLPECTEDFNEETVYISQIIPQMHYLGKRTCTLGTSIHAHTFTDSA